MSEIVSPLAKSRSASRNNRATSSEFLRLLIGPSRAYSTRRLSFRLDQLLGGRPHDHDLPRDARFCSFLFAIDQNLARTARKKVCPCSGHLHCANYLRKPRGTPVQLPEPQRLRLSFCCDRDGCRKRATPPSVRFVGPKVYLGAVIIVISAMRQGPTPRWVRELSTLRRRLMDHRSLAGLLA
jgi:hypothetical protein